MADLPAENVTMRQILEAILADAQEALERVPERGSLRDLLSHIVFNAEAALRQFDGKTCPECGLMWPCHAFECPARYDGPEGAP